MASRSLPPIIASSVGGQKGGETTKLGGGGDKLVPTISVPLNTRAGSMTSRKEGTERELAKLYLECCQQAYSETAVKEAAKVGNQVLLRTGTFQRPLT